MKDETHREIASEEAWLDKAAKRCGGDICSDGKSYWLRNNQF
jgi:hypothetical protein